MKSPAERPGTHFAWILIFPRKRVHSKTPPHFHPSHSPIIFRTEVYMSMAANQTRRLIGKHSGHYIYLSVCLTLISGFCCGIRSIYLQSANAMCIYTMFCPRETATEITSTTNHDDDDDVDIDYVVADKRIHINSL